MLCRIGVWILLYRIWSIYGATLVSTGRIDSCLEFDGSNDYVSVLAINTNDITFSAWVYRDSTNTVDTVFNGMKYNADNQLKEGFLLRFLAGNMLQLMLTSENDAGTKAYQSSYFVLDNTYQQEWIHVAFTYNKVTGEQKLYVTGELKDTDAHPVGNTISPLVSYSEMQIGSERTGNFFHGKIDDVKVYDTALTEEDIAEMYVKDCRF